MAVAGFKIGEAAELLGVSPDTVRRWADAGKIGSAREPGGRRLIDGEALARFAGHHGCRAYGAAVGLATGTKPLHGHRDQGRQGTR